MTDRTTARKLRNIAGNYPDEYLACRDHGHSWQPREAHWRKDRNIQRTLVCSRCQTHRTQILDKHGYVLTGTYSYADGYPMKGLGRLDTDGRAIFRRAAVGKLLN